jgi:hypothetical protein
LNNGKDLADNFSSRATMRAVALVPCSPRLAVQAGTQIVSTGNTRLRSRF